MHNPIAVPSSIKNNAVAIDHASDSTSIMNSTKKYSINAPVINVTMYDVNFFAFSLTGITLASITWINGVIA
jgi:hypothetical protein